MLNIGSKYFLQVILFFTTSSSQSETGTEPATTQMQIGETVSKEIMQLVAPNMLGKVDVC